MALTIIIKPASSMCNLDCKYCFYKKDAKKRLTESFGFMKYDTIKNIIRKTINSGEKQIAYVFQGGEPTLVGLDFYKNVVLLQKKYNRNNVIVTNSLQTNATLLNREFCAFLHDNRFLVGVSLDGYKVVHDKLRSDFDKVMEGIKLLREERVNYNILCVVSKANYRFGKEIYDFFKEEGFRYLQFIPCIDDGEEHNVNGEDFGIFMTDIFNLFYEDFKNHKQPYIRNFDNYIGILAGIIPEACEHLGRCVDNLAIEADGSAYPCDFYMNENFYLGNLNNDSYINIHDKKDLLGFINNSISLNEKCESCEFKKLCRGGCKRMRHDNLNVLCEGYRLFFKNSLERMTEISNTVRVGI